jgi:rhodanese-related sulfurtransferase
MSFKSINIQESAQLISEGALVVDVREPGEYNEAHLADSVLIPLGEISAEKVNQANPENKKILIHCRSGKRSKMAVNILVDQNFAGEIFNMDAGINGWIESGQPVVSDN